MSMCEKDKAVAGRKPTTYGFERQRPTSTALRPGRSGVGVRRLNLKPDILGDSPMSHSRSYQLPMLMPCRQQAAAGGQNVIGGLLTLTVSLLVLSLSVYPVL